MKLKFFSISVLFALILCTCNCTKPEGGRQECGKGDGTVSVTPDNISTGSEATEVSLSLTSDCEWGISSEDKD